MGEQVKQSLAVLLSCIAMPVGSPAALLHIWFPAQVLGKAVHDSPDPWAAVTHVGD